MEEVRLEVILKRLRKMDFTFEELGIDESLMRAIKAKGITAPIKLLARGDGTLELLDGVHRLAIAVKLKMRMIPVVIKNEV